MNWLYRQRGTVWQVGYFAPTNFDDGMTRWDWVTVAEHFTANDAADAVHYLNGGAA